MPTTDRMTRATLITTAVLGIILTAASLLFHSSRITYGVASGVIVVCLNLFGLTFILRSFFRSRERGRSGGLYLALYILKFFAIIGIVFFLVTSGWIDPIAFAVGITVPLVALLGIALTRGPELTGGG